MTEPSDLDSAARALDGQLRRTTRFRLLGGRCFHCVELRSLAFDAQTAELAEAGARFAGTFALDEVPETVLRLGLLDRGRLVTLVVAPPGRPPYAELTTWFEDGGAITTNGRGDPIPPRPSALALVNRPGLTPAQLVALHRERVSERESCSLPVQIQRGLDGPLLAVARYLDALGL